MIVVTAADVDGDGGTSSHFGLEVVVGGRLRRRPRATRIGGTEDAAENAANAGAESGTVHRVEKEIPGAVDAEEKTQQRL